MRPYITLILLLSLFYFPSIAQSFKAATYNIRLKTDSDVGNMWEDRKEALCDLVKYHQFDIFGTQEGFIEQLQDMKVLLPYMDFIGVGRDDGKLKGEHSAIFYSKDRFDLLDHGTFWLSGTDLTRPNKGWDAALPRICTWGIFKDKKNDRKFIFMNTHFDHVGVEARSESAKLILNKANELAHNLPLILTGDFNIDQHNEGYKLIAESEIVDDAYALAPLKYVPNSTFNGWGKSLKKEQRIDHIFVSKEFDVSRYGILTDTYMGKFPSDHFPVLVDIDWKQ